MQRGHVYIHGTDCPSTRNGQHLVELPDEDEADRQKPGWCRMCALEFPRLEIENELLREALTWAVDYLRGHVNVERYPDFRNAAKLVDGEQAVNYGHFQTVQNLWEHVGWQEKEIATLKGRASYLEAVKDGYHQQCIGWQDKLEAAKAQIAAQDRRIVGQRSEIQTLRALKEAAEQYIRDREQQIGGSGLAYMIGKLQERVKAL